MFQVLVLFHILSAGYSDLNKLNFANPFGMLAEETVKGMEFVFYTLDIVESVDANNEFDTLELAFDRCNTLLYLWILQTFFKFLRIDANGVVANSGHPTQIFHTVMCNFQVPRRK